MEMAYLDAVDAVLSEALAPIRGRCSTSSHGWFAGRVTTSYYWLDSVDLFTAINGFAGQRKYFL